MNLLGFLPVLTFAALFLALLQTDRDEGASFVGASLAWGVFAVLMTELLSLFRAVSGATLAASWALLALVAIASLVRARRRRGVMRWPRLSAPRSSAARVAAVGVAIVVVLSAVVAWFAPEYLERANLPHEPVAHWARRCCHPLCDRQQFRTICRLASILAFGCMSWGRAIGWSTCPVVRHDRCRSWHPDRPKSPGANETGQWVAALFVATLRQDHAATGVMTDYVVALWISIAVLCVVEMWQGDARPREIVSLAASIGLAMATKQTALAFLAPFLAILPVAYLRGKSGVRIAVWALLGLLLIGLLNAGHLVRNLATYGNPGGLQARIEGQLNQIIDARVVVSNLLRNASLHWARRLM
jgi:hypothetical protein